MPVFREVQPLAIGIDSAIVARLPDIDRKALRAALRRHTGSTRYLKAMQAATARGPGWQSGGRSDPGPTPPCG